MATDVTPGFLGLPHRPPFVFVHELLGTQAGASAECATTFDAGKLGEKKVVNDNVLLGDILVFNKNNIGNYDF